MNSSDIAAAIAYWNNLSTTFNRYFSIVIFLFGIIGNMLNVFVLAQPTLRTNPCSFYFLISSVANLIAILSGLTSRMLSGWALDLTNTIDWLCKFRAFVLFVSRNIASWLILLAAIDRWLLSAIKIQYHYLSTLKNAQRGIIVVIIISIVLYSPIIYCYQANLINAPLKCYSKTDACRLSNDLIYSCVTILFPICFMLIFGVKTIFNIQRSKNRIQTTNGEQKTNTNSITVLQQSHNKKKKLDRRLFFMLFIQVLLLCLFTLPQAIQKLYSTIRANQTESAIRSAIENFLFNFVLLLTYFANGMPFYIYTMTGGTVFRNAIKDLFKKFL